MYIQYILYYITCEHTVILIYYIYMMKRKDYGIFKEYDDRIPILLI